MDIKGVERVVMGVQSMADACRFFNDFGLQEAPDDKGGARFATEEGTEIVLRPIDDPALPPAVAGGSNVREIVWGVASEQVLGQIEKELGRDRAVMRDANGAVRATDPNGYAIAFCVTQRKALPAASHAVNFPGAPLRRNRRVDFSIRPRIRHVGHVVIFAPNLDKGLAFYRDRLGFRLSDSYPGRGLFMRAAGSHDHHNLFMIKREEMKGLHHVSFEVTEFNDVMIAGMHMQKQGWKTYSGPGRHRLGSNYFWYFDSPCGGAMEIYSDMDYLTDEWQAREWEYTPDIVAAWTANVPEPA
ncbi:MAG: bleomycin resistance protein [Betaproteobacteria bacterium]|nr:bleomycin resistance protein [Betaproteobacteria bacterium]